MFKNEVNIKGFKGTGQHDWSKFCCKKCWKFFKHDAKNFA